MEVVHGKRSVEGVIIVAFNNCFAREAKSKRIYPANETDIIYFYTTLVYIAPNEFKKFTLYELLLGGLNESEIRCYSIACYN